MGGAERALPPAGWVEGGDTADRAHRRSLQGLGLRQLQSGQAAGEHGLAGPGRTKSRLWAPAAATSRARLACSWPRTSRRSGPSRGGAASVGAARAARGATPLRCSQTSSRWRAGRTSSPETKAASAAFSAGRIRVRPASRAAIATGMTPATGRRSPDRASSPRNSQLASASVRTWREAPRIPKAMGRSKRPPSLGKSAGARLMVTRPAGNWNRPFSRAPRTRSLLSFTAISGSPTIDRAGNPEARSTSTVTTGAWIPSRARL